MANCVIFVIIIPAAINETEIMMNHILISENKPSQIKEKNRRDFHTLMIYKKIFK